MFELMECFMDYKSKNSKDCLMRYKLISRSFKKFINYGGNETKLSLAFACYKSSLWGEAQNFLDKIGLDNWDLRVLELYKDLSIESNKIKFKDHDINLIPSPLWTCVCVRLSLKNGNIFVKIVSQLIQFNGRR